MIAATCLAPLLLFAQAGPVLFYSDLESGPAIGGEGAEHGAFVCIYGERFGAERGSSSVEVGGVSAANYKLWTDPGPSYTPGHYAKACIQVHRSTPPGPAAIRLRTARGQSNELPFTVAAGKIYFASASGNDQVGDGTSAKPWRTSKQCKQHLAAGDICYLEEMTVSKPDNYGAALWLDAPGEPNRPKAIVAYPGAKVVIDANAVPGLSRGLSNFGAKQPSSHWVIAGLVFDAPSIAIQIYPSQDIRLVDNDILCTGPHCYGQDAGLLVGGPGPVTERLATFGNRFYEVGCHEDPDYQKSAHPCAWLSAGRATISSSGTNWSASQWTSSLSAGYVIQVKGQLRKIVSCDSGCRSGKLDSPFVPDLPEGTTWQWRFAAPPKFFHTVYFGNTNSVWFGWNEINGAKGQACRGLLFHSTAGTDEYDLHIHDNDIHDTVCDCLALSTVDPSKGPVEVYNNTLHHCGVGSIAVMQSSYAGIYVANAGDALPNPSRRGDVQILHNTIVDAGIGGTPGNNTACIAFQPSASPRHGSAGLSVNNNLCIQRGTKGQQYFMLTGFDNTSGKAAAAYLRGSNNDCFGLSGSCPSQLTKSLSVSPGFVLSGTADFHLKATSPIGKSGLAFGISHPDPDGIPRSASPAIGAYEPSSHDSSVP